ncbi:MAG: hypothetical protein ABI181_09580 [Mycobacteriaceae bacterium]
MATAGTATDGVHRLREEVGACATRFGDTAALVQAATSAAEDCTFSAASAGRHHAGAGTKVSETTVELVHTLMGWQKATTVAANHVVAAVTLYTATDTGTAVTLTGTS